MRQWTLQERQRQAELIKKWKPWKHSTGAVTPEGKEASKMNAMKDGAYSQKAKAMKALISEAKKRVNDIVESAVKHET